VASRCATFTGAGEAPARQTLWLTVQSDQPRYYFYPVVARPRTYRWSARDVELGTEAEQSGEPYEVGIAQADEATSRALYNKEYSQGVAMPPAGLRIVDQIAVRRNADTRPCRK
jgi:hypothetical protein